MTSSAPVLNLDPAVQAPGGYPYPALIFDRLMFLDVNDAVIPGLATKWNFAADGSYLELTLRDDVTFHDGTPFDADAVKVNIERGQTIEGSTVKVDLAPIQSVKVVDKTTVRLMLKKGEGVALPSSLATAAGMMVSPTAIADGVDLKNNPGTAGSGPYVATEFVPNEKLVVKRADSYWDPAVGRVAGIELLRVPDAATRLKGVQTGDTDLTFVSSANELTQAKQLADSGALQVQGYQFRNVLGVMLRGDQGDLAKPEVRQAIAHSIDPQAISALFSGMCTPTRSPYPTDSPWAASGAYPYEYDLEKAKQLIQSVGGATVPIAFGSGTNTEQPANVIQSALSGAGIKANLTPLPNSEVEPRFIAGDFPLEVTNTFNPRIDPASTVDNYLLGTYRLAVDPSLVDKAAAAAADPTRTTDQRAADYQGIWTTMLEQAWFIPLCNLSVDAVAGKNVVGIDNVPWANVGLWDLRNVALKKN
ncbi:ABC transporter substrate-binding protein [Nakamurella lactea]|uniref:ABC transporter substrate-binding protein n=1 Tax=Nakamurella lactea TaxID=459515 RepID=UPI001B7F81E9|nr:ABC transporter substrate-binding protein [Nakamurella lactea]